MSAHRTPDRLIHHFILEGEERLQDQVFDAIRAEIEQKRQRVVIGPWRTPIVTRFVTIGLTAAAVVVIGVLLGSRLIGPSDNAGGPSRSTSEPTATPVQSVAASPSSIPAGSVPEGSHILWQRDLGMTISVTIPAPGWYGQSGEGVLVKNDNADAPDGAGLIVFAHTNDLLVGLGDIYVYGDPCHWASTKPDTPVTTVDEAVAALSAQASRDASATADVTVDGYTGKSITLHVPDDAVFRDCDGGEFRTFVEGDDAARHHQDPGQIDLLWILNVKGELAIFDVAYYEGTPPSVLDEVAAIVESAIISYSP